MRARFPWSLIVLLLFPAFLSGCGGLLGSPAGPTPVFLPPTATPPVYPFVPGVHRYVGPEGRLTVPTPTPAPTPTRLPTPEPLLPKDVSAAVPGPAGSGVVPGEEGPPSCIDEYRGMLIDYRGRVPFGSQVALQLSRELEELRPDCVAEGWAARFEADVVCVSGSVAGLPLSPGLTWRLQSLSKPQAAPTARDGGGNILVHFARLPFVEARGCWFYRSSSRTWAWFVSGGDSGVDRPRFPLCEGRLRDLISSPQEGFGPLHVVRALDEVRLQLPSPCSSPLWDVFPSTDSHEDCGVPGGTWVNPEGFLVVTWHEDHTPADGAVCWALPPGGVEWEFSYPVEVEE